MGEARINSNCNFLYYYYGINNNIEMKGGSHSSRRNTFRNSDFRKFRSDTLCADYLRNNTIYDRDNLFTAIEESNKTGDHETLRNVLRRDKMHLRNAVQGEDGIQSRTVVRTLIEEVTNGNQLVRKQLDDYLKPTANNPNSKNYGIEVDFTGIVNKHATDQCQVLYDLIEASGDYGVINDIITHPVIALFISAKWKKIRKFYFITTLAYFFFLVSYSILIHLMFGTVGNDFLNFGTDGDSISKNINNGTKRDDKENCKDENEEGNGTCIVSMLELCTRDSGSLKPGEIFCFIVFILFTTLLVLYEMYQVAVLRKQYMQ